MADDESVAVLGKRKQRDEAASSEAHHSATLFVSNLPYTATSTDLQTLFSDFAPVRTAFVVLENGASKGVGYVSFAIKGDAEAAMESIEKDGVVLDGRKLRVTWAQNKPKDKPTAEKSQDIPERKSAPRPAPRPSVGKLNKDPDAIRTVVISGFPPTIDQKTIWKKVRKCPGAERVELVEGPGGIANATFATPADAARAVERLHAHVFKGALLSVALKKRLENLEKVPVQTREGGTSSSATAAPSRASRLIVRNIPWNITETDLRALFLPYGPIYSISIPTEKPAEVETGNASETASKTRKPRARGFAFVWFFSKKDAERAIAGVNGRAVRAGAVSAPTMNKKERARLRRRQRQEVTVGEEESEDGDADEEEGDALPDIGKAGVGERIVAVDWALSKEKWEEAKAKGLAAAQDSDKDGGDVSEASGSGSIASEEENEDGESAIENDAESTSEVNEDGLMDVDGSEDDEGDEQHSDVDEAKKPMLPQTDVGTTLFIRNLSFDATEDELRTLFRTFGPLRYARITIDPEMGRSRGTGFVCFWNKDDADKALAQAELLAREAGVADSSTAASKKNPFTLPSLLTPDPSSSLAQPLVLHGRTLSLARAVPRDAAARLLEANLRAREKADKRNLYLLRVGLLMPGSPAARASGLSEMEIEKRQASFDARQRMVKRNLALFVSRTRLSIRGLPLFTSERGLKRLAVHAVREFEAEVARGERAGLKDDEIAADADGETLEESSKKRTGSSGKNTAAALVLQAKIVRDANRAEALTRAKGGRSKGYGFLELHSHADALRVLRWADANTQVGSLLEAWWVEELEGLIKEAEGRQGKQGQKSKGVQDEEEEDLEARLKRLKQELERLKAGKGQAKKTKKALLVEFSIENAQVVSRRREKLEASRTKQPGGIRTRTPGDDGKDDESSPRSTKRQKLDKRTMDKDASPSSSRKMKPPGVQSAAENFSSETTSKPTSSSTKVGNKLGSLIGRKRKQRQAKGKAV